MCPPLYKHQPSGCTHTSTLQDVSYSLGDLSPIDLGRTEGMIIRSDNLTLCSIPGQKRAGSKLALAGPDYRWDLAF